MSGLIINGKNRLDGEITIQGSKNSCLPMLAACILMQGDVIIENCPDISDVREMLKMLQYLGCNIEFNDNVLKINSSGCVYKELPYECGHLRGSLNFLGAMLSAFGKVKMPKPGGCNIGERPIDYHIEGMKALMTETLQIEDCLCAKVIANKVDGYYCFPTPSLGALENLILRALSIKGTCIFDNCTLEPEMEDFCDFLIKSGAKIYGVGTRRIIVVGGHRLTGIKYRIPGDRIVAGTYLLAVAITGGKFRCKGVVPKRLSATINYLKKIGIQVFTDCQTNEIIENADQRKAKDSVVITGPYPEFSTDLQSQMMAFACFNKGNTVIKDLIYPSRYGVASEFRKMGADISVVNDIAIVRGGKSMKGCRLCAKDLRGGAALVIASLGSEGSSYVCGCEFINRGYQDIARDLRALGADIRWNEEDEESLLI